MISTILYICNLDSEQESYGLGDSLALLQLNIEQTPTKPELGNAKLQNYQISGSE